MLFDILVLYLHQQTKTDNMTTHELKIRNKVESKLVKYNKPEEVADMMSKHYETASRLYPGSVKHIFEFIVTVY